MLQSWFIAGRIGCSDFPVNTEVRPIQIGIVLRAVKLEITGFIIGAFNEQVIDFRGARTKQIYERTAGSLRITILLKIAA